MWSFIHALQIKHNKINYRILLKSFKTLFILIQIPSNISSLFLISLLPGDNADNVERRWSNRGRWCEGGVILKHTQSR